MNLTPEAKEPQAPGKSRKNMYIVGSNLRVGVDSSFLRYKKLHKSFLFKKGELGP